MKYLKIFEEFGMEQTILPSNRRSKSYEDKFSKLLRHDSDWLENGWLTDSEKDDLQKSNNKADLIRNLWNKKADHVFFNSLIKIHWIKKLDNLEKLFSIPKSSELCCNGFYKDDKIEYETWSNIGVILDGDVVFAGNQDLETGWEGMKKVISNSNGKSISLNKDTFLSMSEIASKTKFLAQAGNELIVTNFEIKEIIIKNNGIPFTEDDIKKIEKLTISKNIPLKRV